MIKILHKHQIYSFSDNSLWPKTTGIYALVSLYDDKIYIGQSQGLLGVYARWMNHRATLRNNKHRNAFLQNSFNKHQEHEFGFILLEECSSRVLFNRERYWMMLLKPYLWNLDWNSEDGRKNMSDLTKAKLSQAMMGRVFSDLHRQRIAKALTGKQHSFATRRKQSLRKLGMKLSQSAKDKISKSYILIDPLGQKRHIFNLKEFARSNNLCYPALHRVATGKANHYKGWTKPDLASVHSQSSMETDTDE